MLCAAGRAAVFSPWNFRKLVDKFVVMWKLYNSGEKFTLKTENWRNYVIIGNRVSFGDVQGDKTMKETKQ